MSRNRIAQIAVVAAVVVGGGSRLAWAQELWITRDGTLTLMVSREALGRYGLALTDPAAASAEDDNTLTLSWVMDAGSDLGFVVDGARVSELFGLHVRAAGGLELATTAGSYTVLDFALLPNEAASLEAPTTYRAEFIPGPGYFELTSLKTAFDRQSGTFSLASREVRISGALAEALGRPDLVGQSIGRAVVGADAEWLAGDAPPPVENVLDDEAVPVTRTIGPDMTFCQLYYLHQYGREGDVVGLAVATTSWNIGDEVLPWYQIPNANHPFIVMNLYRLKTVDGSERFEQIGQSWIKHGFYALSSSQCGSGCQATGGTTLGIGCTDTYVSSLNAVQNGMGPRYEVNPWTRAWTYAGSEMHQPYHDHDGIEHRIQVHDADLDPAQNPGATYYCEGFYACPEDVNQMNSASWKPVTVSGSPGGTWSFSMSPYYVIPEVGFAIDAWTGTSKTVLAQELPVVEFVSPDGRCVLAATVTDLGDGTWHYEYALLNVDMDRKVGFFSLPIDDDGEITNIGFNAVASHDEPYSNDPWTVTIADDMISWGTADNPLRWGTLYNFRFDANLEPVYDATVTLGLFDPGPPEAPATVSGITIGPLPPPPDCNNNGILDLCDLDCGPSGGECDVAGCGESGDCNSDGVPDECSGDCNGNGTLDACDIFLGLSDDCNNDGGGNGIPDECEIDRTGPAPGGPYYCTADCDPDCNDNGIPDECDISSETSDDCDGAGVPDECDPDFDGDGLVDGCDPDIDNDGVSNATDPCDYTPAGTPITQDGRSMGDWNADCDVSLGDYRPFKLCMFEGAPRPWDCERSFDFDGNGDLDLHDFAGFQNWFTGP